MLVRRNNSELLQSKGKCSYEKVDASTQSENAFFKVPPEYNELSSGSPVIKNER